MNVDRELLQKKLIELETEHRRMNLAVDRMAANEIQNEILIRKVKKEKLKLKDQINYIKSILQPDNIA